MSELLRTLARPALTLAGFGLAGTLLLAGMHLLTAGQIAENQRQALLDTISTLVDPQRYDNDPLADSRTLDPALLQSAEPVTLYPLRKQGNAVATLLQLTTPDGYSGNIRLIIGINADQTLAGVRVLEHRETPGLGDWIDVEKSDWILGFSGKSLQNPSPTAWAVRKDGGEFDQFSGATITPRAVVAAVRRALEWSAQTPSKVAPEVSP